MRKLAFLLLLLPLVAVGVYACDEAVPTQPTAVPGAEDMPHGAAFRPTNQAFSCDTWDGVIAECPLEDIEGELQFCVRERWLRNGEMWHATLMGWGEGLSTGDRYTIRGATGGEFYLDNGNASIGRGHIQVQLIGLGQAPDYRVAGHYHGVYANGETRVEFTGFEADCAIF